LDLSQAQRELRSFNAVISQSENVTELGVFIRSDELFPSQSIVELVFYFEPQNREVKSIARVAWVSHEKNNEGMGVEIFKISQELYSMVVLRAKRGNWIEAIQDKTET
jgi:hypothetical protein